MLPEIPENLIAKPTLTWLYDNTSKASHDIEVSYLTSNISWKADYVLLINQDDTKSDLSGWVSLDNRSGTTYKDAKLKLCLLYTSPSPRDGLLSRMPSSA